MLNRAHDSAWQMLLAVAQPGSSRCLSVLLHTCSRYLKNHDRLWNELLFLVYIYADAIPADAWSLRRTSGLG
jgi:hypothetical protein